MANKKKQKKNTKKASTNKKKTQKKQIKKAFKKKVVKKKVVKKSKVKVAKKKIIKKSSSAKKLPQKTKVSNKQASIDRKVAELEEKSLQVIEKGKKRGFVTYDEIIKVFPDIENNILFLDELYERLSISGIDVLEGGNLLDMDDDIPFN